MRVVDACKGERAQAVRAWLDKNGVLRTCCRTNLLCAMSTGQS